MLNHLCFEINVLLNCCLFSKNFNTSKKSWRMDRRKICNYYPNCSKGDSCTFLHESPQNNYSSRGYSRNSSRSYESRSRSRSPSPYHHSKSSSHYSSSRNPIIIKQDLSATPLFSFSNNVNTVPSRVSNVVQVRSSEYIRSNNDNSRKNSALENATNHVEPQKTSYKVEVPGSESIELELCMCSCDKIYWTKDGYDKHKQECRSEGNIQWSKVFTLLYKLVHTTDLNPILVGKLEATILRAKADNALEAVYYFEKLRDTIIPFIKEMRKDEKISSEAENRRYLENNKYCAVLMDVISHNLQNRQHEYEMSLKPIGAQNDNTDVEFFN